MEGQTQPHRGQCKLHARNPHPKNEMPNPRGHPVVPVRLRSRLKSAILVSFFFLFGSLKDPRFVFRLQSSQPAGTPPDFAIHRHLRRGLSNLLSTLFNSLTLAYNSLAQHASCAWCSRPLLVALSKYWLASLFAPRMAN